MNQISLDAKGGQFLADLANWQRESDFLFFTS